jgi:DNA anti-recombination protein RmuC
MIEADVASDKELQRLMARFRQDLQQVHEQLNVMDDTLKACSVATEHRGYKECVPAVSTAEVEAHKFSSLTKELLKTLDEMKNHVLAKHL